MIGRRPLFRGLTLTIAVSLAVAPGAAAQLIERPERPITGVFGGARPPDPERTRQDLTLSLSLLGGYDDHLSPLAVGDFQAFAASEPGYTGFADAMLSYRRGRKEQSFAVDGRTFVNTFRNAGLAPGYGGVVEARFVTPLSRRLTLELSESARNEPNYGFGAFAPLGIAPGAEDLSGLRIANGFAQRRSWAGDTGAALTRTWRHGTTLRGSYHFDQRDFRDDVGDQQIQRAWVDYTLAIGHGSGIRASYRHSASKFREPDDFIFPVTDDSLELGFQHERQIARRRRLFLAAGTGATHVDTINRTSRQTVVANVPTGYGGARVDLGRTWSFWADYRRGVAILEGLTADSFVTDTALLRLGGFVARRSEVVVSAAYSDGAQAVAGSSGRFDSYTGTAQFRFLITRLWSAVTGYTRHRHALRDVLNLPAGFPRRLDRHVVQVGLAVDLPLYGAYLGQRHAPATQ